MWQIDARQQVEHLHDAVTWFKEHPLVDDTKVALWGLCFGGNVTLAAAAFEYVTLYPFPPFYVTPAFTTYSTSMLFNPICLIQTI